MRWLLALAARLRSLVRRDRLEREMEAELRFHLDKQIAEHVQGGMSPGETRLAAVRATGSITGIKKECRESLGLQLISPGVPLFFRFGGR